MIIRSEKNLKTVVESSTGLKRDAAADSTECAEWDFDNGNFAMREIARVTAQFAPFILEAELELIGELLDKS